jgi:hypothetical protein
MARRGRKEKAKGKQSAQANRIADCVLIPLISSAGAIPRDGTSTPDCCRTWSAAGNRIGQNVEQERLFGTRGSRKPVSKAQCADSFSAYDLYSKEPADHSRTARRLHLALPDPGNIDRVGMRPACRGHTRPCSSAFAVKRLGFCRQQGVVYSCEP